jgi:hypothetical protein
MLSTRGGSPPSDRELCRKALAVTTAKSFRISGVCRTDERIGAGDG